MRWFHREQQPDVWEVADDQPLGDIGAAHKIRDICASAGTIAERLVAAGGRDAEKKQAADAERSGRHQARARNSDADLRQFDA